MKKTLTLKISLVKKFGKCRYILKQMAIFNAEMKTIKRSK